MAGPIRVVQVTSVPNYVVFMNRECQDGGWDSRTTFKHYDHYSFLVREQERELFKGDLADAEEVTLLYDKEGVT